MVVDKGNTGHELRSVTNEPRWHERRGDVSTIPTFVVGTGRCGSTMISNMLRDHPSVLSLSEFFSLVTDGSRLTEPFSPEPMDGRRFWKIVGATTPFMTFQIRMRSVRPADHLLYPYDEADARYSVETGVPSIVLIALPHLTADPVALYDLMQAETAGWPVRPIADHYRSLFGWLVDRFGKKMWIERSGASLGRISLLLELFPEARFIHIARDGRDVAISMEEESGFRIAHVTNVIAQHLGVDPLLSSDRTGIENVPGELRRFLPENFTPALLDSYRIPVSQCVGPWVRQIQTGVEALGALPANRVLNLRYEDFFADPLRQINALASFLGRDFCDEEWAARCAAAIRQPRSSWRNLPADVAANLTEACRPGFETLQAAGIFYDVAPAFPAAEAITVQCGDAPGRRYIHAA
jgi:hypothetical protein